jgi:hypothetical protein
LTSIVSASSSKDVSSPYPRTCTFDGELSVRAGGAPNYVLLISPGWFDRLFAWALSQRPEPPAQRLAASVLAVMIRSRPSAETSTTA